jgi:CRISPR/Cas system-associated endonuclease Cas1
MEEYRRVIVDPLVLTALNRRTVSGDDFQTETSGRLALQREALKRFLELLGMGDRQAKLLI